MGTFFTLCYLITCDSKKNYLSTVNCGILLFNQGEILECIQRWRQDMHVHYYQPPNILNQADQHGLTKNNITFKTSHLTFTHLYITHGIKSYKFCSAEIILGEITKIRSYYFFFYKDICICNLCFGKYSKKIDFDRNLDSIVYQQRGKNPDLDFKCSRILSPHRITEMSVLIYTLLL